MTTIFVNPIQFAPTEDLSAYPRDPEGDAAKAAEAGATVVFTPAVEEMYPRDAVLTSVSVAGLSRHDGGSVAPDALRRGDHGVTKLFSIVGPCRPTSARRTSSSSRSSAAWRATCRSRSRWSGCPIVREADGLAMSSRNVYLTAEERAAAPVLHRALQAGAAAVRRARRTPRPCGAHGRRSSVRRPPARSTTSTWSTRTRSSRSTGAPRGPPVRRGALRPGPAHRQLAVDDVADDGDVAVDDTAVDDSAGAARGSAT